MDYVLLTVVLFLVGFGLLMIYSVSSYEAGIDYGDSAYYLKNQAQNTVIGFVALFIMIKFPYRELQRLDVLAMIVSAILIVLVKSPIGITRNGASRWIDVGITTFQPAEVAKIGVIIYLASIIQRLESLGKNIIRTPKGLAIVLVPPTIIAGLVYVLTSNLSSAIIIMGIAVAMVFVAVPDYKWFVAAGVTVLAAAPARGQVLSVTWQTQTRQDPISVWDVSQRGSTRKRTARIRRFRHSRHCMPSVPAASGEKGWGRACRREDFCPRHRMI